MAQYKVRQTIEHYAENIEANSVEEARSIFVSQRGEHPAVVIAESIEEVSEDVSLG